MSGQQRLLWVREVLEPLKACLAIADSPRANIEWLLLRCRDTLRFEGDFQRASLQQLESDVAAFVREFPEQLSAELRPDVEM